MAKQDIKVNRRRELPKKLEINTFDGYMQITHIWHSVETYFTLLSAVIFNGIWIINGYSGMALLESDKPLVLKLLLLIYIAIGLGLIYFTTARWLNKTQVYVSKNTLEVKHQPIPWFGNKRLKTKDIKQIFVKEIIRKSNRGGIGSKSINVEGLTSENKTFKLVTGVHYHQNAVLIEKKIEEYLGIENEEMSESS